MIHIKTFSLSMQKQFAGRSNGIDHNILNIFTKLKMYSLLRCCGLFKENGIAPITLLYWIVLFPFLK